MFVSERLLFISCSSPVANCCVEGKTKHSERATPEDWLGNSHRLSERSITISYAQSFAHKSCAGRRELHTAGLCVTAGLLPIRPWRWPGGGKTGGWSAGRALSYPGLARPSSALVLVPCVSPPRLSPDRRSSWQQVIFTGIVCRDAFCMQCLVSRCSCILCAGAVISLPWRKLIGNSEAFYSDFPSIFGPHGREHFLLSGRKEGDRPL